ncbi:MAG TPA: leucyl aminopeptidase family protein [Acetobacteraceae bacterium]|nr:leucyl aminopeptidase family protein [Acetobacteraceae bacterium]
MLEQAIDCIVNQTGGAHPLWAIRPTGVAALLETLPPAQAAFLRGVGFKGASGELQILPGTEGIGGAVLGLGEDQGPHAFGALPLRLPEDTNWRLQSGDYDPDGAVLGFCLGAYRYTAFTPATRSASRLASPEAHRQALAEAAATWMVRDLINTPPNLLGPVELAAFTADLAQRYGAAAEIVEGERLETEYPTVAAVGRGSVRPARVATFRWQGSSAHAGAPLVSLCGKGVCFDTGGYDLKPSAAMLRMKKDMGGAANILGLARLIMEADLPVRLAVRVGCVENSVSGSAMRPSDVIRTRSGFSVEVGNTDAEGRLVLCDLLAEASAEAPSLLVDCATLTGAARVALGPDLPALFCNDDDTASDLLRCGATLHDPLWRLPLWGGYDDWLKSSVADMNNVSSRPLAGAITAGLFLQRFVRPAVPWIHIDLYAWNDQARPGRPEGGEAQGMRALFGLLNERHVKTAD